MAQDKQALYAGIYKPNQVRKGVLLIVRDTLALLKRSEHISGIFEQRRKILGEIHDTLAETTALLSRAKKFLPDVSEVAWERKKVEQKPQVAVPPEPKRPKSPVHRKIDLIEGELSKIESQLRKIQ